MTSDSHARLLDAAVGALRSGKPCADLVGEVVGLAAAEAPSPVWDAIAATDIAADVARTRPWFLRQFEERPPPADLTGLWFGLYVVRGAGPGRTEATVALSGGPGFPDPAWLTNQTWEVAGYLPTAGLRGLLPLAAAEEPEVRALVAGPVVFAYSMALAAAVVDDPGASVILGDRPQLGVVVGLPGGDTVVAGVLTAGGFDRSGAHRVETPPAEEAEA